MTDAGKLPNDMAELFRKIRENRVKLDACPRHLFGEVPGIEQGVGAMFGRKMECLNCGGLMDSVAVNYYIRGYEASGRSGNDILPGWKGEPGNGRRYFKPEEDA